MKKLFALLMVGSLCFPAFTVQETEESTFPEKAIEATAPATDAVQEMEESTSPEEATEATVPATEDGTAALMQAAREGHTETVKALIEGGVDVNAKTPKGSTALMFAAREGHTETVKALIDGGTDVNAETEKGTTALMVAARSGYTEIVELLKQAGAAELTETPTPEEKAQPRPETVPLPADTVRVIGKNPGKTKGRWLNYGDDIDLKGYSKAYFGNIAIKITGKEKAVEAVSEIDKRTLTEHIEARLKTELESSDYFSVVAADPPSEENQEKWLRIDVSLLIDMGSRVVRYFGGFGAGKSKSVLEIFFKDHKTANEVAKYHGYGIGSGMAFKLVGGGAVKMTRDDIDENTKECVKLWGQAIEGKSDSNAQ
jgi:ankyrin repeat protein